MNCHEAEKLITLYLDGEFSDQDRIDIEEHLAVCSHCKKVMQEEKEIKKALQKISLKRAPIALRKNIIKELNNNKKKVLYFNAFKIAGALGMFALAVFVTSLFTRAKETKVKYLDRCSKLETESSLPSFHKNKKNNNNPKVQLARKMVSSKHPDRDKMLLHKKFKGVSKKLVTPSLLENLVVEHVRSLNQDSDGKGGIKQVGFGGKHKRNISIKPPRIYFPGGRKIASAVSRFNGFKALKRIYKVGDKRLTLFIFDAKMMPDLSSFNDYNHFRNTSTDSFLIKTPGGRNVALFAYKGIGYSLVSSLNKKTVVKLVDNIIRNH